MHREQKISFVLQAHRDICDFLYAESPPLLVIRTIKDTYGEYDDWTDTVAINVDVCKTEFDLMDTMLHEHAHAAFRRTRKQGVTRDHGEEFQAFFAQLRGVYLP